LKLERWGSILVQEKYQQEKACDKKHPYNNNNNNNNNNNKHKLFTLEEPLLTPSAFINLIHHCDVWESKNTRK
jgi:hypothetical protein